MISFYAIEATSKINEKQVHYSAYSAENLATWEKTAPVFHNIIEFALRRL